ncbi:hypothetical protein LTR85_002054 [Meristemomyces frigidus]|nr:hypothetical protein LTR85_002054 [Meristemomyces frigidus]
MNVATANACLVAYRDELDNLPEAQAAAKARHDKPGKKVLLWLWSGSLRDVEDYTNAPGLMYLLTYCLVIEGDEDLIWQWLNTTDGLFDDPALHPLGVNMSSRWRSFLMRSLVLAKMDLVLDDNADPALEVYSKTDKLKHPLSKPNAHVRRMSLVPMISAITTRLCSGIYKATPVASWDNFATKAPNYLSGSRESHRGDDARVTYARLMINRPQQPDVAPALDMLRKFAASPETSMLLPTNAGTAGLLTAVLDATARLLGALGRSEDEQWVQALQKRHTDGEFVMIAKRRRQQRTKRVPRNEPGLPGARQGAHI